MATSATHEKRAILGANDGLVSIASVMMGVGAVKRDIKAMLLAGFAGLVAGRRKLPSPFQESVASAFLFLVGGLVPLMAAEFVTDYKLMVIVLVSVSSKTSAARSCSRMLLGGWMAMAITYACWRVLS
ncbi:hypothetical protein PRUPE_1G563300 [Prunus persica]|uniref:Vacuolar iron transporter n=1 Tax=Prunus persica TaxID=3760 RepID=M5XU71_PRUPE|nr:hypothetical protein PRUPE_1G563300 [Prunus persica]